MTQLKFDTMFRPHCLGLGLNIGSNTFCKGLAKNIFVEFDFLFWTFGVELGWS